jgi:hypothetical protein
MIFINDLNIQEATELRGLEAGISDRLQDIRVFEARRRKTLADIAAKRNVDVNDIRLRQRDPDLESVGV